MGAKIAKTYSLSLFNTKHLTIVAVIQGQNIYSLWKGVFVFVIILNIIFLDAETYANAEEIKKTSSKRKRKGSISRQHSVAQNKIQKPGNNQRPKRRVVIWDQAA